METALKQDRFDEMIACDIEPKLPMDRPVFLYDYPAACGALARLKPVDKSVAERFELFVRGVELANGYHELLDPEVLRTRNSRSNQLRRADGKYTLPEDSRLLAAMQRGLPPSAGVGLRPFFMPMYPQASEVAIAR